jgi:REP element-mobilizing transposase RayT
MGHTFTNHLYHIVFSTAGRRELITTDVGDRLRRYICGVARKQGGLVLAINGTKNHVHLLARLQPRIAFSDFVKALKANSSRWVSEAIRGCEHFQWQAGYSSFSVSESNWRKVAAYIEGQEEHHRRTPFERELAALLRKHRVQFDPAAYLD